MNKKEVIKEISDLLIDMLPIDNDLIVVNTIATSLLQKIEDLGMKPPCQSSEVCQALMSCYIDPSFNRRDEDIAKDNIVQKELYKRRERKRLKNPQNETT